MTQTMAVEPGDYLTPDLKELQLATGQNGKFKDAEVFDEDFESDDSDVQVEQHGPEPTSQKRKAQNAAMRAFAARVSEKVTEKEVKEATGKTIDEETLSLREMLENEATINQIMNPRDYQIELFQKAKQENIIAVLDTGSGKTHIATLLIRDFLEAEQEHRANGGQPRTTFFLVNSVNLVFQQANVLHHGIEESVEGICGAMGASLFDQETWQKHFQKNMVIVCTAEVLSDCLMHGYMSISQINLLIFDECHHTKQNHPFARIMKDHYRKEIDPAKRPRVFGMTASPLDVKGQNPSHVRKAASDLEELLHSKIATATESMLASNSLNKPEEVIAVYAPLRWGIETHLHQQIKAKYNIPAFQKYFVAARQHAAELGNFGADSYFSFIFAEKQSQRLQNREQYKHSKSKKYESVEEWDETIEQLQSAANFVQTYDIGLPTVHDDSISPKVQQLHKWLMLYYERSSEARCIVFVTKRQTARILKHIFDHIGGPNLHCDVLVGVSNAVDEHHNSVRSQFLTLSKFRKGAINCLFATSVAEEGLDIPQCSLVVRFDLYRTMIGYVQSRGRARHSNSKYLHMLESGNAEHREIVFGAKADEAVMRKFCRDLPSDRKILDSDTDFKIDIEDALYPTHEEPTTGAKLTFRKSLVVLHHFAATWPYPSRDGSLSPVYVIRPAVSTNVKGSKRGFQCEVMLPEGAPISSLLGDVQDRKGAAKCSAAFRLCLALRDKGCLDANLLPTSRKRLPEQRNALLALKEKKGRFPMFIKPDFWKEKRNEVPKHVYLTIIDVSMGLGRPHQPLGLLTRQPFPKLPSFPIFLSDKDRTPSDIVSHPLNTQFAVTNELANIITDFTLQVFEAVFNKLYEKDIPSMSYWVVPIAQNHSARLETTAVLEDLLDMGQIRKACHTPHWRWTSDTDSAELLDKYLIDPLNGGRRWISDRLAPHKKPLDTIPDWIPRHSHKYMDHILDYTDSKWSRTRDISRWNAAQPVLEVDRIPSRRNYLAQLEPKEEASFENLKAYVCPEPLRISNLSVPFVVSCYILPAVIHRFESYLIALDACKRLDLKISPALALQALTKDSENSGEHGEEQINYKSGMGPNYERLELLGDCVLKQATTISVFVQMPDENEFEFHVRRMVMLCNQNLLDTAVGAKSLEKNPTVDDPERNLELPKYIRTAAFSRRTWYPEGIKLLRGKGSNKAADDWLNLTHNLGDKSIADVCEAFIGACFQEYRKEGEWDPSDWDEAVKAVKLFTNSKDHLMAKWSDYHAAYQKPKYQLAESTAAMKNMAAKVEEKHAYHFRYPRLCRSAFTHPSQPFMVESIPNYQRLEFLGDALLDMAFITYLFYKYPDKDPQWLTEHKTPMVSNRFLGMICVKLGMHVHIKHNNAMVSGQIRDYAVEAEQAEREANGAVDWWVSISEPPKCLADVIEAYVAAMFVDSEFDFRVVQRFFDQHLKPFFADMEISAYEAFGSKHPTTRLSHIISENFGCRDWRMGALETESLHGKAGKAIVAMVVIHGHVHFYALGKSGRYARVRASQNGLKELEGLAPFEFRDKYGCRCEEEGDVDEETKEKERKDAMGLDL